MVDHLAHNWGNWASVIGLVFSILAFMFSKKASKAAEDAKDAVLRRSLAESLSDARKRAADIERYASAQQGAIAAHSAGDLLSETSFYLARWAVQFSKESSSNLERARSILEAIHKSLVSKPVAQMTLRQKGTLIHNCQKVTRIFSEEHGKALKSTDGVEQR